MKIRIKSLLALFIFLPFLIPFLKAGCGTGAQEPNTKPTAVITPPNPSGVGDVVYLDGTESSDPDGDVLTYHWTFDSLPAESELDDGSFLDNDSTTASSTSFIPDKEGIVVIRLVVNDGIEDSPSDYAILEVSGVGTKPIADAGEDEIVYEGQLAILDGSGSYDTQGLELTYQWSILSVPEGSRLTDADLEDADTDSPSFITDTYGVYTISLVVNNGILNSDPDFVFVTAISGNTAPIAYAGDDIEAYECTTVTLDGSGSIDSDHDPLSYEWSFVTVPLESEKTDEDIEDADTANCSFYADVTGIYFLQLIVYDGEDYSSPDIVMVEVLDRDYNNAPVAEAGPDVSIYDSVTCYTDGYTYYCSDCPSAGVNIDGSGSYDADNDELSYYWSSSSSYATFSDEYALDTIVSVSDASATYGSVTTTTYTIYLTVTDCMGESGQDYFTITYECEGI